MFGVVRPIKFSLGLLTILLAIWLDRSARSRHHLLAARSIAIHSGGISSLIEASSGRMIYTPWILFMLDAIQETAQWTTQKIRSIRELMEITTEYVKATRPKLALS